ncbi:peptidylprolyl isomerase [Opitutales bacterium]|nr:peptidylprolyl isomerase [Opitutales bacterium]
MSIKINDQVIPDWAIERQAEALYENVAKGMPGKPREIITMSALDLAKERLIDQALMAQESRKRKYQVDGVELQKRIKLWLKQNGGKKAFEKINNPMIKNHEDLKRELSDQMRFNQLLEEESQCEDAPDEDAIKYYEERPELFRMEEQLTASHLLKMAKSEEEFDQALQQVEEWRKRLKKGEDFTELVLAESDDKGNDGNLGTFGRGRMVPEFENAAYALEPGELSEPVKTQFGWHLIQLHERVPEKITPFDEIKQKVVQYLTERKKDKIFEQFLDGLKAEAKIDEVSGI